MTSHTKRLFLWFVMSFLIVFIILISISLFHNFTKPRLVSLPARELRGVWMSRFDYTQPFENHDPEAMKTFIRDSFQKFKQANFNVIFFQVRGNGDAFYNSQYEPWSDLLTGQLGQDPGWDPLNFAIETAHQLGLELHAWINVFPAWRGKIPPPVTKPIHPYLAHPDWLVCDSDGNPMPLSNNYVSFSAGIPAVHDYLIQVVTNIVSRYDIDGIHFDYLRYPDKAQAMDYSHDPISRSRFNSREGNPLKLDWDEWQREQLTQFVAKVYNNVTAIKPEIKVSAAVVGSYKTARWNGYSEVFQDARRWVEIGKIDLVIPMTYYGRNQHHFAFAAALKEWKAALANQRLVFPGLAVFHLDWKEIIEEIHEIRNHQLAGMVMFAASSLDDEKLQSLESTEFKFPAIIPAMNWKDTTLPATPTDFSINKIDAKSIEFTWQISDTLSDKDNIKQYVIYRSLNKPIDLTKGENILAIIPGSQTSYRTEFKLLDRRYHYTITSLNDAYNESPPYSTIKAE
ncbi:MAG: family 10 glycosylhydrolase [Candidatus Marinimicrobia bacterium]|nr:family 10 glycosylhydrolase [Candidatus Neomarinimicrobiota bacterium]